MREALESVERIKREHGGGSPSASPAGGPAVDPSAGVEMDIDPPSSGGEGIGSEQARAMEIQIETLSKELEAAQAQIKDADEKYKRSLADQENFRKRTQKERLDIIRFGHEKFANEVLQVLDNFERALSHTQGLPVDPAVDQFVTGIRMTATMFQQALEKYGIKQVPGIGSGFDPAIHQAMQQAERTDVPPGQVVDLYQKGYMIYERLLRPALVSVSKAPVEGQVPPSGAAPEGAVSGDTAPAQSSDSGNGSEGNQ